MFSHASNKPLIAVLTTIPNISNWLLRELKSFPVGLLSNPANVNFDSSTIEISEFPEEWLSELDKAQIVISDPSNLYAFSNYFSSLKWCQSTFAGPDATIKTILNTRNLLQRVKNDEIKLTRIGKRLSMPISEYVVSMIIRQERRFDLLSKSQDCSLWAHHQYIEKGYRSIKQLRFGIFGIGDIGCTIAKSLKYGFDAQHIIGLSRTSKSDDKQYQNLFNKCYVFHQLDELLENEDLDYIICALPATKQTEYILNINRLKKCKTKPVLINIGRGNLIKTDDLINALDSDVLSGAVLDVFEQEPLNQNNKLWNKQNVIITPHVAALTFPEDVVNVFMHNLDKYLNNEELQYLVDIHRGY